MTILLINSSIQNDTSVTRELSQALAQKIVAQEPAEIITRDLTQDMQFISSDNFKASATPKEERTPLQIELTKLADTLIDELFKADTIIIGAPIYNFGPPASLKAWADLVARAGTTFKYTASLPKGLLQDKKTYIVTASGGTEIGGPIDFMTNWLKFYLRFLGIKDVTLIKADGMMGKDRDKNIAAAHDTINRL